MIERFFIWCSGAVRSILDEHAQTDRTKFVGIGATIFFTAVLATFSGGYAMHFTFQNAWLSTPFGLLWGFVIFNLDRYIVSSMKKSPGPKPEELAAVRKSRRGWLHFSTWLRDEGAMALPRLMIAIVLAIIISTPIELRLFKDSIEVQFNKTKQADLAIAQQENQAHAVQLNEDRNNLITQSKGINKLVTEDPLLITKKNEEVILGGKIKSLQSAISSNNKEISRHMIPLPPDSAGKVKYTPDATARNLIQQTNILKSELKSTQNEYNTKRKEVADLEDQLAAIASKQMKSINNQLNAKNQEIADFDSIGAPTRIAAREKLLASNMDLPAQIKALSELRAGNESVRRAGWAIALLFLLLECSPVIVKLLSKRGPYDVVLERMEYEVDLAQKQIVSDLNDEVNNRLKEIQELNKLSGEVRIRTERSKLDAEMKANEALLHQIASRQADLAEMAVDKWYKEERARLENDPKLNHAQGNNAVSAAFLEHGLWKRVNGDESYLFQNGTEDPERPLWCIKDDGPHKGSWQYVDSSKQSLLVEVLGTKDTWTVEEASPHRVKLASTAVGPIELLRA